MADKGAKVVWVHTHRVVRVNCVDCTFRLTKGAVSDAVEHVKAWPGHEVQVATTAYSTMILPGGGDDDGQGGASQLHMPSARFAA